MAKKEDKRKVDVADVEKAYQDALDLRLKQVEEMGVRIRDLTAAIASGEGAGPGMEIYSVAILDCGVHFNTYLGVATDPQAAQGAGLARAMAKGAKAPIVAECNVVGRLDFA